MLSDSFDKIYRHFHINFEQTSKKKLLQKYYGKLKLMYVGTPLWSELKH